MGFKAMDKSATKFEAGDILTSGTYSNTFAIKVISKIFVQETGKTHYITEYGEVGGNAFKSSSLKDEPDLAIRTLDSMASFKYTWTPDKGLTVKSGDVLKDATGRYYVVASEDMIWRLDTGTHAGLSYWQLATTGLKQVSSANGKAFSDSIEIKSRSSYGW